MIDTTGKIRAVNLGGAEGTINVGSYELYDQLFDGEGSFVSEEASRLDSGIFFYVSPDDLKKSNDELARLIRLDAGIEQS